MNHCISEATLPELEAEDITADSTTVPIIYVNNYFEPDKQDLSNNKHESQSKVKNGIDENFNESSIALTTELLMHLTFSQRQSLVARRKNKVI